MKIHFREQLALVFSLRRWCVLEAAVGVLSGVASAGFLVGLAWATEARESTPWFLRIGGTAIGRVDLRSGKDVEGADNLRLDRIHAAEGDVSWRMAPLLGGFGSVFGTPLAGTVFGLELLAIGRIRYDAPVPCFVASTVGDHGNSRLPLYVELLGPREALEAFCRDSAELLRGRFMVYKDVEPWSWEAGDAAAEDAP